MQGSASDRPLREPFVMVPTALRQDPAVSPLAVSLWALLDDVARGEPTVAISVGVLARTMVCSDRTVQRLRRELVAAGWLAHRPGGGRGVAGTWMPLRRARQRVTPLSPYPGSNGDTDVTVSADQDPLLRAGEEAQGWPSSLAGSGSAARPSARRDPWCGSCDEATRLVDVDDGRVARCPACHPLLANPF